MKYYTTYLQHHGIKGQKWGVRRFQNYDGTRIKKYGTDESSQTSKKKGLTDKQKTALKIGAIVVGTALVAYGGYKLTTNPTVRAKVNDIINGNKEKRLADIEEEISNIGPEIIKKSDFGGASGSVGKSLADISTTMVSSINQDGWDGGNPPKLKPEYARNCAHTSIAYIMNSVLGKNVSAKGYGGVDEISGLVTGNEGRSKHIFDAVFDGLEKVEIPKTDLRPDKAITHIKNNSTGILRVEHTGGGHFINYECDKIGNITIIDGQSGKIGAFNRKTANQLPFSITDIIDCSNATLREDASKTLEYLVK